MCHWMFTVSLFFLLGVLLTSPTDENNEHYFIVSSPDQCDSLESACMTLSSLATNTHNYLQVLVSRNNAKISFSPGNHTLDSNLTIAHINQLWLYYSISFRFLGTNNIVCIKNTARIEFINITRVHISNIKFLGCGGNRAELVIHFALINTIFDGQQKRNYSVGTALELVNSTLKAEGSSFISYIDHGAVIVNESNATFLNCKFEGNHADFGGAIYGNLSSNISIVNSTLSHNSAAKCGGAVFVEALTTENNEIGCGMLSILGSNFSDNIAEDCGGGAAVFHANVSTHESRFTNNVANSSGGALFSNESGVVNISGTDFSSNSATNDCGGAVHVLNSTLLILNSSFSQNSNRYGGALCLLWSTNDLRDCSFNFNEATRLGGAIYTQNSPHEYIARCTFERNIVLEQIGAGRSMRIYREANLTIVNSSFINHGSVPYGHENNNHTSTCQESNAGYRVSGVSIIMTSSTVVFNSTRLEGSCESIYAYKCNVNFTGKSTFIGIDNEQSKAPSALYIIQSTVSINGWCTFKYNVAVSGGAIHTSESRIDVNGELEVVNNTALDNGGGIYLYRSDFNCRIGSTINILGNCAFKNGGGIHAISSAIKVTYVRDFNSSRALLFINSNAAVNGGGISLEANAKLLVLKEGTIRNSLSNSSIYFMGNNAEQYGGAVYVADETNAATCEDNDGSFYSSATECFIQVVTVLLFEEIRNDHDLVSIEFKNNSAPSGGVIFGGLLDRCTISPIAEINKAKKGRGHFGFSAPGMTYLLLISNIVLDDLKSHEIRSKSVQICFCIGDIHDDNCSHQPAPVKVTHGQEFTLSLVAVDQVNHTVPNVVIFSSIKSTNNWLSKGQIVQNTNESCTNLTFSILSSDDVSVAHNDTLSLYADGPCKSANRSKREVQIHLQPCSCAVGFQISAESDKCDCVCDSRLEDYTTTCNVTRGVLVREKSFWLSATTNITLKFCDSSSKYLGHLDCPFEYCVPGNLRMEINLSRSDGADVQCANNRTGIFCSQCKPGYSLSVGSSRCIQCSKTWIAQTIGSVLAVLITGIALVTLLLVLNLTVAIGTINGLIFYANIVGSTSRPLVFAQPELVVAWLNLDPGFDGCIVNGLDAYWKTWLKFVFPVYIFILVVSIIVVSRFCSKFSRIIGKRNPVATLNTLILLSYSKLLHLVISVFLFTTLNCPGGSSKSVKVWVVDATIKYLSPKHFALFVAAILILFTGTVYTFLLFSWQWLLLYQDKWYLRWVRNQKLCQFLEPYHAPYTVKHRYWTGLLLLVRVVVFTLLATNTSQNPYASLVIISIAASSLILIKGVCSRVYKNHLPNLLETFSLMNILFLCIANFYTINKGYSKMQIDLAYVSGSTITLLLLVIVAYHVYSEILIKSKIWIILNELILKSKAMVRNVSIAHRTIVSNKPSSNYTTSVVEAPKNDEQLAQKHISYAEPNLRELLLESSADGRADFLY